MKQPLSTQPPTEDQLIDLLGHFQPRPSTDFQQRMTGAPWQTRQQQTRRLAWPLRLAAVTAGLALLFILFQPQIAPLLNISNTPTATYTATATMDISAVELTATDSALTLTASMLTPLPNLTTTPLVETNTP